jgi:energy-converting hydrogenase B subunit K
MFLSTNTCDGKRECIKQCPTKAIRFINGKAFSCLTCGICYKNCPNGAIFQNSYGGYVVDRAKCNGCGMCMHNCPTSNITIEDGIVYGICSRCGVCSEVCPNRVDGYELEKDKQLNLIRSLQILYPPLDNVPHKSESKVKELTRTYVGTDEEKCILCGRCQEYCPTGAIHVRIDRDEGICSECRLCSDVCPNESMNKLQIVNKSSCTLCLNYEGLSS